MNKGRGVIGKRRCGGLAGIAFTGTLFFMAAPSALMAQVVDEAAAVDESQVHTLDAVSVVGSRIRRVDETAPSQVFTVERAEIEASGIISIGELLQKLPAVGSSFNSTGSGGTSHGSSSINLRSLGPNRSLVLVNGRRWVNGAGTRGFRDFVDFNTIPLAAVERIEVLLDGATAIYGADAIAGVINIVTFADYDGLRLSAYLGITDEGDGFTHNEDVLWGRSGDWGSALLTATVADTEEILVRERDFAMEPLRGFSRNTPTGRFRNSIPVGDLGTAPFVWDGTGFRPDNPSVDVYNEKPDTTLVGPLERKGAYGQTRFNIGETTTLVLEGMFNSRESSQRFSAATPRIRGGDGMTIPADHPFNPFGVEFRGSGTSFEVVRMMEEVGPRLNTQKVNTSRLAAGLEGEFSNAWRWNAFYTWAQNKARWISNGQIDLDRVALALGPNDRCAAHDCVPLNVFGAITPQMADYIRAVGIDYNGTRQRDFTANLTGDLFQLPAGALAFAAGVEYRKEEGWDDPSPYINQAPEFISYDRRTTSAPRLPTRGSYDLKEAYAEFNIPLLADMPGARQLELSLASRHSRYSTFGNTTNSKAGLVWRPVEDLMLRATWAQGFRAPSINELYAGLRTTNLPAVDPCNNGGGSLPGCAGVPTSYHQSNFAGGAIISTVGGNPDLMPETSTNRSVGFIYTPSSVKRLSWSLDWYEIDLDDAISNFGSQNLLNLCANTGLRCNFIRRDTGTGEIINLSDGPINLNRIKTSGIDSTFRYELPEGDLGRFELMLTLTRLSAYDRYDTLPNGEVRLSRRAGMSDIARESFPRWRANTRVDWSKGAWSANWSAYYIGRTDEGPAPAFGRIPSHLTHNVWGAYAMEKWPLKWTLGVQNLFDRDPPRSYVNGGDLNFDMSTYNPIGRFYYLKASFDF